MKIKEIEKTYKEKVYVAVDGKEFKNEADCKEWENSYKCTIKQSFDKLPKMRVDGVGLAFPDAHSDDDVLVVEPESLNDIALINAYVQAFIDDGDAMLMDTTYIGKKVVLNFGDSNEYFSFVLFDDLIKHFNRYVACVNKNFTKSNPIEKAE